jgi:biuret amidohydrolase
MVDSHTQSFIILISSDRGFYCIAVSDACASYRPDFHTVALEMISAQGGIFGSVTDSTTVVSALLGE